MLFLNKFLTGHKLFKKWQFPLAFFLSLFNFVLCNILLFTNPSVVHEVFSIKSEMDSARDSGILMLGVS